MQSVSARNMTMKIGVILCHNKGILENEAQIVDLLSILTSSEGRFTITDLDIEHELSFFQIVPFGTPDPKNIYDIPSHKVRYGLGDEDKTGEHSRFLNWSLKRSLDYGCDVCFYITDAKRLNIRKLKNELEKIADQADTTILIDNNKYKLLSKVAFWDVGQLREDVALSSSVTEYKNKVTEKGYKYG